MYQTPFFTVDSDMKQRITPWMTLDVAAFVIFTASLTSQIGIIKIKIITMVVATI
jgi:hypothetical protein